MTLTPKMKLTRYWMQRGIPQEDAPMTLKMRNDPAPAAKIADAYLTAAYFSGVARTKRLQLQHRYESRGFLRSLEILVGGMEDACRVIEMRSSIQGGIYGDVDKLLYDFWALDRPRPHLKEKA